MNILVLDLGNYIDYPLGGQLSFAKNLITAFGKDAKLVGISTEKDEIIGKWHKKVINNIEYDYYSVAYVKKTFKRPFIPRRITSFFQLKPHIKNILNTINYDLIFIQAPELLLCLSDQYLSKTFVVLPGVENPLIISRYPFAKKLKDLYDFLFINKLKKVKYIFASADEAEIQNLLKRSKGAIQREQIIKYPTRYDSSIYYYQNREEIKQYLNLDLNTKIITTVGRLAWFKGWKFMIDAFNIVQQKYSEKIHFYFLGNGEDKENIQNYIKEKHLEDKITLLGNQPPIQVAHYLNASDVFIMGSYKEGWSTTLVEACACCVPCVVTNFSSAEEMIENGINGYVIKTRSEEEFANQIIKSLIFDRAKIIEFNNKYKSLAVNKMRESLENNMHF
jgi:glycosyltransferase involved in cell wall biosynthesis